ncbi:MAG: DUF2532 domain-containing protein [Rickettsia endosymbiont of Oxypoda opaca]|nr:DUF2532 domain-containing protein [Rickettsia endosymbiont of Oxypoda opaca]
MTIRIIIYFLLFYTVSANANPIEDEQPIVLEGLNDQAVIKLPWNECTDITGNSCEKKLSFSEKQIKKEKKIHKQYEQYYLKYKNPANFSTYFFAEEPATKTDLVILNFLKFYEENYNYKDSNIHNYKVTSPNIHFKRQEEFLNKMKGLDNKMHHRHSKKKYDSDISLPLFKSD